MNNVILKKKNAKNRNISTTNFTARVLLDLRGKNNFEEVYGWLIILNISQPFSILVLEPQGLLSCTLTVRWLATSKMCSSVT